MKSLHFLGLSFLALLAGCSASARRTVVVTSPVIVESEPNDSAFSPDGIGPVGFGTAYAIAGSVDGPETFGFDVYDGFAFFVRDAVEVEFILHAQNPYADLDFYVYDPFYDEYIARFESAFSPEYGAVTFPYLGEEFHIVVTSFSGSSDYTLEVIAHPLGGVFSSATQAADPEAAEKDPSRMNGYLKEAPSAPLEPTTVVQFDRESGELRTFDALHDGDRIRALRLRNELKPE